MSSDAPVLIWDLAGASLSAGDYRIEVFGDDGALIKSEVLRLRSSDNPAIALYREEGEPLGHDPTSHAFVLTASRTTAPGTFRGVPAFGALVKRPQSSPDCTAPWYGARRASPRSDEVRRTVVFPRAGEQSCMVTGAHYMLIDAVTKGVSSVEGICKHCGLVRRYPTRGKPKGSQRGSSATRIAPVLDVHGLGKVKQMVAVDWEAGFDALCHIGGGRMSALDGIASQMEEGSLFSDTLARRLEALGHIEIDTTQGASWPSRGRRSIQSSPAFLGETSWRSDFGASA